MEQSIMKFSNFIFHENLSSTFPSPFFSFVAKLHYNLICLSVSLSETKRLRVNVIFTAAIEVRQMTFSLMIPRTYAHQVYTKAYINVIIFCVFIDLFPFPLSFFTLLSQLNIGCTHKSLCPYVHFMVFVLMHMYILVS